MHEALKGLNGILTIVDDIIVAGCGETEEKAKQDNMKKLEELYNNNNNNEDLI